ncbi:hypothetical protein [Dyella acidiphila]|uniref:Uncharacterized protein n=1 Tax=Dyella acidiphila TaxID=2775866 RepID=A0ABR9GC59_9GAMM|nr:hypothetical protein [Dyella acidiphila]MBE1161625.1 hypothetical protein [Dyella acidiphila]
MMLPFRRRPNSPKQTAATPAADSGEPQSCKIEIGLKHLDYNLQPLNVESLSHYIEPTVDEERFRVH